MRVNVYIADDVMARVDAYCKANGLRRGAFFTMAATDFLNAKEMTPQLKSLLGDFLKVSGAAVAGEISQEEYELRSSEAQQQVEQMRLKLEG